MTGVLVFLTACVVGQSQGDNASSRPAGATASSLLPGFLPLRRGDVPPPTQQRSTAELIALLSEPAWVRWSTPYQEPGVIDCPWAHPAVNVLRERASPDETLRHDILARVWKLYQHGSDTERWNAALVLAALRDDRGLSTLSRRLLDPNASVAERVLAAHALAEFPHRLDPAPIERLLESFLSKSGLASDTSLAGDEANLVAAIAWLWTRCQLAQPDYDPVKDRWMDRFANLAAPELRRIAALAHGGRAWTTIPPTLARLLEDNQSSVRRSALWALTRRPAPAAREVVLKRTYDVDLDVMTQAVQSLSLFPDQQTIRRLAELQSHPSPRIRAAVVRAGADLRQESLILPAITDPSADVRSSVAGALVALPPNVADPAWAQLIAADRSSWVQWAAVKAAGELPADRAVPILLVALSSPVAKTRQEAARLLAVHLPVAETFPADASPDERERHRAALAQTWQSVPKQMALANNPKEAPPEDVSRDQIDELVRIWHEGTGAAKSRAAARLQSLPTRARLEVEEYFLARDQMPSHEFLLEVMAVLDPAYETLGRLLSGKDDPASRSQLRQHFERRPTTELQALLVARYVLSDDSAATWKSLSGLLFRDHSRADGSPRNGSMMALALDRLIERGLQHPDEWVRSAICEQLNPQQAERYAERLAALMEDSNEGVRLAAIRAAGRTAEASATEALRRAVRSRATAVQIQAAAELSRQGDPEGLQSLERLWASRDPEVRKRVMAQLAGLSNGPDREGVLRLLTRGLSDDSLAVRTQAIAGLERAVGYTPWGEQSRLVPHQEQIAQWKRTMADLLADRGKRSDGLEALRGIQKAQESLRMTPVAN